MTSPLPRSSRKRCARAPKSWSQISTRPADAKGIKLNPLDRTIDDSGYHYKYVDVSFDRAARTMTLTVRAPEGDQPQTVEAIHAAGDQWWPLQMARELDDAILMLRTNELELGLLLLKTAGSIRGSSRVAMR